MNEKKRYTSEQKITILRELLEKNMPISQVAEKYGVHVPKAEALNNLQDRICIGT